MLKKNIYEPSFKGSLEIDLYNILAYMLISKGKILKRLLHERLSFDMLSLQFPPHHELYEIFDEKMQQLFISGIIDHHVSEYNRLADPKCYEHLYRIEPQQLTLKNLEAGFVIWLASINFAIVAFVFEWFVRLTEYLMIRYLAAAFYMLRKD